MNIHDAKCPVSEVKEGELGVGNWELGEVEELKKGELGNGNVRGPILSCLGIRGNIY